MFSFYVFLCLCYDFRIGKSAGFKQMFGFSHLELKDRPFRVLAF